MSEYMGIERRKYSEGDHDLLVEVHTMLKGMKENYDKHVQSDEENFVRLYKITGDLKWYIAIGIGILATLKFIFK